MTPVAVSVADACNLEKGSRGRSLIVISCWTMSIFPSISWWNGTLYGPVFTMFLPEGPMRDLATHEMWFRVMAPWLVFGVVFAIALYLLLKPEKQLDVTKGQMAEMFDELGAFTKQEKGCLFVLIFMVVCLILQNFLPFSSNQAMLASFALLLILGVLSIKDISTSVNWDAIFFTGMILGFAQIFEVSGLMTWVAPFLASFLKPIAFSPLVFVTVLFALCILIRFVDVSQGWISTAIFALMTPMLFVEHGIHPLIPIFVFVCASNLFFFRYAQPWIVQIESITGDNGWNPKHLSQASVLYVCLAGVMLVISRFYWGLVGVI